MKNRSFAPVPSSTPAVNHCRHSFLDDDDAIGSTANQDGKNCEPLVWHVETNPPNPPNLANLPNLPNLISFTPED